METEDFKRHYWGFDEINQQGLDNKMSSVETPQNVQEVYKKIFVLIPLIRNLGFNVDIVPLVKSDDNVWWTDYAYTYLNKKDNAFFDNDFMYFTIYIENTGKINVQKNISVNYSSLTKEKKCAILSLFYDTLSNNFEWDGDNNKTMTICYDTIENPTKLNFHDLRSDDTYPLLKSDIWFKTTNNYGLFEYLEKDDIIAEIESIIPSKIACSYGDFDIEMSARKVNMVDVINIYSSLTSILSKVKRKHKNDFGVKECKLYYFESFDDRLNDNPKKYIINCDPIVKDRFFDFDKYLT